jgi:hypothetical protein
MYNNPLVRKIGLLTVGLNKTQLDDLLTQVKAKDYAQLISWFQNQNNPLTPFELEQLQGKHHPAYRGVAVINSLIGEWKRSRRVVFVADAVRDDLKPVRAMVIDKAVMAGETEDYGAGVFLDALKSLVEELSNG